MRSGWLNAPNRLKAELQTEMLGLEFRIYAVGLVERTEPPEGGTPNGGQCRASAPSLRNRAGHHDRFRRGRLETPVFHGAKTVHPFDPISICAQEDDTAIIHLAQCLNPALLDLAFHLGHAVVADDDHGHVASALAFGVEIQELFPGVDALETRRT